MTDADHDDVDEDAEDEDHEVCPEHWGQEGGRGQGLGERDAEEEHQQELGNKSRGLKMILVYLWKLEIKLNLGVGALRGMKPAQRQMRDNKYWGMMIVLQYFEVLLLKWMEYVIS